MSINVVTLIGRVGSNPDVKCFESGKMKCQLTLAVRRLKRNSDEPDWFTLELWDKTAEIAANYVKKGSQIGVKGALKFETWSDNNGNQRSRPIIRVDQLDLLGSKRDQEDSAGDFAPENF